MARKRMIDPDFWTDEALGLLPVPCRLLFMGLISNADDEGRLRGHPGLIRATIFPYDELSNAEVDNRLEYVAAAGLIRRYEVDGQMFIDLPNFLKHQTINKPTPSKLPSYDERTDDAVDTPTELLPEDYGSPTELLPPNRIEEKLREEKGIEVAPKPARVRKRDPLFEAIAEAWKGQPYHADLLTPDQSALVGKCSAAIAKVRGSPEDVPGEWALLRERFDNPTPAALAKHWGTNGTGLKHDNGRKPDPIAEAQQLIIESRKSDRPGRDALSIHE